MNISVIDTGVDKRLIIDGEKVFSIAPCIKAIENLLEENANLKTALKALQKQQSSAFPHPGSPGLTKMEYITIQLLTGRVVIEDEDIENAIEAAQHIIWVLNLKKIAKKYRKARR